jgi:hypothetical protein
MARDFEDSINLDQLEDGDVGALVRERSDHRTSDTADHLHGDGRSEAEGTRDVQEAIEEGRSYNPPDGPFQEGVGEGERR